MDKDSDYPIFQLAKSLGLHQVFGPMPSAQMLVHDILQAATMHHHHLYIQRPVQIGLAQFPTIQHYYHLYLGKQPQQRQIRSPCLGYIFSELNPGKVIVDPFWGNIWEASSSTAPQFPKVLTRMESTAVQISKSQNFDEMEIEHSDSISFAQDEHNVTFLETAADPAVLDEVNLQLALSQGITQSEGHVDADLQIVMHLVVINPQPIQTILLSQSRKRKYRKRLTPVVDDEVRRSARLHKVPGFVHMELDERSKPRKLAKEDTALMQGQLQQVMEEIVTEEHMLPIAFMQNLAINYCEVAPEDVTEDKLLSNVPNDNASYGCNNAQRVQQKHIFCCALLSSFAGGFYVSTFILCICQF